MILAGLWFGPTKPQMATFTMPLHKSLQDLETGVEVEIGGKRECCKAFLICLTADLPAKKALLNMNQFNYADSIQRDLVSGEQL